MFNGLGLPAIDQTGGGGLYFGGGFPAGWAFEVTNTSPRLQSFYTPTVFDQPIRETAGDKTIKPVSTDGGGFILVPGDGPPTVTAQTAAQTMAATLPSTAAQSLIPGVPDSFLLIGGGLLALVFLTK